MYFLKIILFLGGLALFLYSLKSMSDNLQSVAGRQMKSILKKLTNTPFKGVIVGTTITGIVQSSSAVSVMLLGLVNAQMMNITQAIGVILGANIGTTFTAQLIAFRLQDYCYLFIIVGVILVFLCSNKQLLRWGYVLLSFGLLFVGLATMSDSVTSIKSAPFVFDILSNVSHKPFLAIIVCTIFTMIIQSSSAAIGIIIVLGSNGIIEPLGAMYLLFGAEIGTTITAWIASLAVNRDAKRVALFHSIFNISGAIFFALLTMMGIFPLLVNWITPGDVLHGNGGNIARYIANTGTLFNVIWVLIVLPFTKYLVLLCEKLIKDNKVDTHPDGIPRHLDPFLMKTTELAVEQSIKEMCEMILLVKKSLLLSMESYLSKNFKLQDQIIEIENGIDNLQKEITLYLVAVSENSTSKRISRRIPSLLHTVNDIEKLGDYAETINELLNNQILAQKITLNENFNDIIHEYYHKTIIIIDVLLKYLSDYNITHGNVINELSEEVNSQNRELRKSILLDIQNANCDPVSGIYTIDYLDAIEDFAGKIKNIVHAGSLKFEYNASELRFK